MDDYAGRARAWLASAYGGLVELADTEPIHTTERSVLFGSRYVEAKEPMLAATICVPMDGRDPFPAANSAPLDDFELIRPSRIGDRPWRWSVNARNCVVAADTAVDGNPASALPWQPADESPGWWDRLLSTYFPDAEVAECGTWSQAGEAIVAGGQDTRGVIWLRRHLDGRELTGHLLYARYDEETDRAAILDPQLGTLASVDDREVDRLLVARFRRPIVPVDVRRLPPWEVAAEDFPAAVAKAESWLDYVYSADVRLVGAEPDDETRRGWLFACSSRRFLETGDWRDQMLDAALLVPKEAGASPFGLPNRDPWSWLRQWDDGATGLPAPPAPGEPAWYKVMIEQIGPLDGANPHENWAQALDEIATLPTGEASLIWLRRKDFRGRETVGHLLWALNAGEQIEIFDPTADTDAPPIDSDLFELRVFRVDRTSAGVLSD